ncbi:hypothetical protein BH10ACT11_BH10ACT11_04190 [soil metagenome]
MATAALCLFASPASARTHRCFGKKATIVANKHGGRLVGTSHADVIVGRGGDDFIIGKAGDDRICAGPGDDYILGKAGDDRIATGPGNNGMSGDRGDDILQGGSGPDDDADYPFAEHGVYASIAGGFARGQGHDTLRDGVDELFGSIHHADTLIGDERGQLLVGFGGDDKLRGGPGDDLLAGGQGDDLINGGAGDFDILDDAEFGGPHSSGPLHLDLAKGIERGHGTDRLKHIDGDYGSPSDDVLKGTNGQNVLVGGDGDDRIFGRGGPDLVEGDFGNDSLDGGPGTDYSSSFGSPTAVNVDLAAGTLVGDSPADDSDTMANIEDVQGSAFDDTIIGDDGPNALRGDPGGDTISGAGGKDMLIGDCGPASGAHFFFEDVFDCSSPGSPDTLDGGGGTDSCSEGETVIACESSRGASRVQPRDLRSALTSP